MVKRILQILSAAVLSVAFVGSVASAADCDGNFTITNTGSGSNNTIDCTDIDIVSVTCENNIVVLTYNDQEDTSGTATVTDNTTGGSAVSGTVTNVNGTTIDLAAVCAAVASPSPSPSVTPGAGSVTPTSTKPTVLPFTAGNSAATIVAGSLAAAAGVVVVSRLAIAAYRRISVK